MDRWTGRERVRWAINAFGLAGAVLSGVSCRGTDIAEPTEPSTGSELRPALATTASALAFRQVSAGSFFTCGVTTENRAYCWGQNADGELGIGTLWEPEFCHETTTCSVRPMAVVGGLLFKAVAAGYFHACGVTTENQAYCWGTGNHGQLGDGTADSHYSPSLVAGTLRFRQVSAGSVHT